MWTLRGACDSRICPGKLRVIFTSCFVKKHLSFVYLLKI